MLEERLPLPRQLPQLQELMAVVLVVVDSKAMKVVSANSILIQAYRPKYLRTGHLSTYQYLFGLYDMMEPCAVGSYKLDMRSYSSFVFLTFDFGL